MKARTIPIGNSRGVRIPKSSLDRSQLTDDLSVEVRENEIVIRPAPRQRWEEASRAMAERRDDLLIDDPLPTSFDETEWES